MSETCQQALCGGRFAILQHKTNFAAHSAAITAAEGHMHTILKHGRKQLHSQPKSSKEPSSCLQEPASARQCLKRGVGQNLQVCKACMHSLQLSMKSRKGQWCPRRISKLRGLHVHWFKCFCKLTMDTAVSTHTICYPHVHAVHEVFTHKTA